MTAEYKPRLEPHNEFDWESRARDVVATWRVARQHGGNPVDTAYAKTSAGRLRQEAMGALAETIAKSAESRSPEVLANLDCFHKMCKILDGEAD
jgi:hypothetical protein